MKLYNTLTQSLEEFIPIDKSNIKIYVCGPTVYDRIHLGNARSTVTYDLLYRVFVYIYGKDKVTYVRNITDIEDKINARAKELGISIKELTTTTYEYFKSDTTYLGCLDPNHEPRATDHINDIIKIIEILVNNGYAYISEGHVFFDISKAKDYGKLSGRKLEDLIIGARVEVDISKKHPEDFVLWKPVSKNDDISSIFESPWGQGRPGWHIECSAMSNHFLGPNFDIHGGGADLIFPHHTNEIAQSCSAFEGSIYAKYWVHNGFLTVAGEKMSKSLGNFHTMEYFTNKNVKGEILRFLLLNTHYRKPLDYNDKALYDATENMDYFYRAINNIEAYKIEVPKEFIGYLKDDLNTAEAIAYMRQITKDINKAEGVGEKAKYASILKACGEIFGILQNKPEEWFNKSSNIDVEYVNSMIEKRKIAKLEKNWQLADQIRKELRNYGIELQDNKDGATNWFRR